MGLFTSYEAQALRWAELCKDSSLNDLPFKIELNRYGTMEMCPTSTRHARFHGLIAGDLRVQLPEGTVYGECPVATIEGVRVPDVAWASAAFFARHGDATPLPQAPEICVEAVLPTNTDDEMEMKTNAYLKAGAIEVWIVSEAGGLEVYSADGRQSASRYPVKLKLSMPAWH